MQTTPNYGLKKYELNDTADLTQMNTNMDTIDAQMKANADAAAAAQTDVDAVEADLAAHLAETMPHRYQDIGTGTTYQYGFKQQDNHLVFMYQEVV